LKGKYFDLKPLNSGTFFS